MNNRYDTRVLGKNFCVTNDTFVTGLNNNDIVIGGSGSGKTGSVLYPTLKQCKNESIVFVDAKGLMAPLFREELEAKGYTVKILSFVHPECSAGYNPLDYIKVSDGKICYQDIVSLARAMVPELDNHEPIWQENVVLVLQMLLAFCMEQLEESERNMKSILDLYHILVKPDGFQYFAEALSDTPNSFAAQKLWELQANQPAERMLASIFGFVNVTLAPFSYPEIQGIIGNADKIELRKIGMSKHAIFVQVSDTDRTYDNIVNVFMSQALQVLIAEADKNKDGRLKVPTRIVFDDMGATCKVPDFANILSVIRSRDVYVSIVLQSLSQLYSKYGIFDSTTIISNCDHIVFLHSNDKESAEFIGYRANRTVENILCMPRNKQYILTSGKRAVMVDKNTPYSEVRIEY